MKFENTVTQLSGDKFRNYRINKQMEFLLEIYLHLPFNGITKK